MDNSTIIFIIILALALIILRWFISPIPQSVPDEFNIPDPARQSPVSSSYPRQRRQVTDSMIEIVQAIGPHLSVSQIKYSLEKSGSVEATVEALMENGTLPFPPGEESAEPSTPEVNRSDGDSKTSSKSLLEKYDLDAEENESTGTDAKWGKDENERVSFLHKRKAEMILRARKNMKESISENE
ncbi:hypothetical protein JCM33374_g178 [Metschnikowia sp. JCM 33374]|nr:hypothetical protein JCM33374_g178 [Metschnikowia sp. JCM 33374]